ncbi:MAG: DUF447 domain-containing protein [Halobacteriales archaeon]
MSRADAWRFLHGGITEVVAVTGGPAGDNVAPLGLIDGDDVHVRLWRGSDTLDNVRATERLTACFTRDAVVYVEGAVGDASDRVVDGRLEDADAWIACDCEMVDVERDGDVEVWRLEAREHEVRRRRVYAVNRGFNAVVEACVDATRLHVDPGLAEDVRAHLELARKCGGDRERRAADVLESYVDGV